MKKILLASTNKAKLKAVEEYFGGIFGDDVQVCGINCESGVSSKPLNFETFSGCKNRLYQLLLTLKKADLYVAIESGFFEINSKFFISTVAISHNSDEFQTLMGVSDFYEISKNMFECVKNDISLNKIITDIENINDENREYKQFDGILGYITNKKITRASDCIQALSRLDENLPEKLKICPDNLPLLLEKYGTKKISSENFERLDKACEKYLKTKCESI